MLDDVLRNMPLDEINKNIFTVKMEPVGIFGGRKFSIKDSKGEKHIFSVRDMLNHINNQVDRNMDPAKTRAVFSSIVYYDSHNKVTIKEHGFFNYIFTQIRRLANIGFNKEQMLDSIDAKIQKQERVQKLEHDKFIDSRRADITIGSPEKPLNLEQITETLKKHKNELGEDKVRNLIIYANNVEFNEDPGIVDLDPKKLILVGAEIVHKSTFGQRLDEKLAAHENWEGGGVRKGTGTFIAQREVASVEEALKAEVPLNDEGRTMNRVYVVQASS